MNELHETTIYCPYCGEPNGVLVDPSEAGQSYIEDCQVCCRPIVFLVDGSGNGVEVFSEDDSPGGY
ncbi:MAG: CPXCG motif-containing cysteine-rich protein [Halieaceae bacterium]|nr:CPXCG motif-containing cysteine-rich protein [Halieaceae bacterium]